MRIRIVEEETGDSVDLSRYEYFNIAPPSAIEDVDENTDELLEYVEEMLSADDEIMPNLMMAVRDTFGLDEDQGVPEKVEVYFGNNSQHKIYFSILAQALMSQFNETDFSYNPDEVMTEEGERSSSNDTTDTVAEEEEDKDSDDADGGDNEVEDQQEEVEQQQQERREEPKQNETYLGIPLPVDMPMPKTTSRQLEQLASRRVRTNRNGETRTSGVPVVIRSNFQPPEQPSAFVRRSEPSVMRVPQPRPDLDMQTFTFRGTQITKFEPRARPVQAQQ